MIYREFSSDDEKWTLERRPIWNILREMNPSTTITLLVVTVALIGLVEKLNG